MPSNRTRRRRPSTAQPWMTEYLLYGHYTLPGGQRSVRKGLGLLYGEPLPPPWEDVRDELLPDWITQHPGTRPFAWWRDEAPDARKQVGGGECIPLAMYQAHGLPIPGHWRQGANPEDPPLFESQTSYLQRLDLLTATERRWLSNHPEALAPVKLKFDRVGMGLSNEVE